MTQWVACERPTSQHVLTRRLPIAGGRHADSSGHRIARGGLSCCPAGRSSFDEIAAEETLFWIPARTGLRGSCIAMQPTLTVPLPSLVAALS
jgi:hypothetical protein